MLDLGTVRPGTTIYIPFHTFDSNDPSASVIVSDFVAGDIEVYKNGSVTQRASDNGYTLLDTDGINFDGVTGLHGFSIDLADNTTADFWTAGAQYWVVVGPVTVDAATINFVAATFRIGYPDAVLNTTIATLSSQTSFTLSAGPADDDALNGMPCIIHDIASAVQIAKGIISDYTGSTKTVTLDADPGIFTMAAGDNFSVFIGDAISPAARGNLESSYDGTGYDVGGIDVSELNGIVDDLLNGGRLDLLIDAILEDTGTTLQAELDGIQADTEDLQTQIGTAGAGLTDLGGMSTSMKAEVNAEVDSALDTAIPAFPTGSSINEALKRLARSAGTIQEYTIDNTSFTATTTAAQVDAVDIGSLEATDDHFNGRVIVFTSGPNIYQATDITDYDGTNKRFTYTALTDTPNDNDTFIVI